MSGPIVRSGPSPEFSQNWDSVFGKKMGKKTAATGTKSVKGAKKANSKKAAIAESSATSIPNKAKKKLAKKK